jgi:hypothetical protein
MVWFEGDPPRLKSGGAAAVTVKVKVVVWLTEPAVPVTVMIELPGGVEGVVLIVNMVLQVGEQLVGINEAVTPAGRPEALNVTAWVVPDDRVEVTVFVTVEPCSTDLFPSLLKAKSNGPGNVAAATTSMPMMPHQSEGTV